MSGTRLPFPHPRVRPDWLARLREDCLEPSRRIVDPHHHLWPARPDPYLLADLTADVASGHDIRATVFIQCGSAYRQDGPPEMRPVGETEFVAAIAVASETGPFRAAAGIAGHADCRLGDRIEPVLLAHDTAGGGRLRASATARPSTPGSPQPCHPARPPDC